MRNCAVHKGQVMVMARSYIEEYDGIVYLYMCVLWRLSTFNTTSSVWYKVAIRPDFGRTVRIITPLSGVLRSLKTDKPVIYISLLIIFCIIEYVTNKTLNLDTHLSSFLELRWICLKKPALESLLGRSSVASNAVRSLVKQMIGWKRCQINIWYIIG